ncbi:MAG TPA: hypothetical protein VFO16_19070 [Pseudonocardiaceae bacterium]|nr:hypothetical protein [Pseudonocardiaceae bacterium]
MFAIIAAILFAISLILGLIDTGFGPVGPQTFTVAGLLCLALQLAGLGARFGGIRAGGRSFRRSRV